MFLLGLACLRLGVFVDLEFKDGDTSLFNLWPPESSRRRLSQDIINHPSFAPPPPLDILVFGVPHGFGAGGAARRRLRGHLEDVLEDLWRNKCPRMLILGISTLDLGGLPYFYLGGGGEWSLLFFDFNRERIILLCTFATIWA